ncbi:MAG: thrombospondin type 3 repeat-containing protein [bacterium]
MRRWTLAALVIFTIGTGCGGCDDDSAGGLLPGIGEACGENDVCADGLICYNGLCSVDGDGDGIPDDFDNCVDVPNPDQADTDDDNQGDACEPAVVDDNDGDNITDTQDNCPGVPNPSQNDTDGDGMGDDCDDDDDGDGVLDTDDNCPVVPNPDQADRNNDGLGDVCSDPDGDGRTDDQDNCPDVSNLNQSDLDNDGLGDVCDADRDGDLVDNLSTIAPTSQTPNRKTPTKMVKVTPAITTPRAAKCAISTQLVCMAHPPVSSHPRSSGASASRRATRTRTRTRS